MGARADRGAFELAQPASSLSIAVGYGLAAAAIATALRRHRPDVWRMLLVWSVAGGAITLAALSLTLAALSLTRWVTSGGPRAHPAPMSAS